MNRKAINFFELLSGTDENPEINKIIIPEIQRDYVQGRKTKTETSVRENLISDILHTLKTGNEMELYFIYGKIEERNGKKYFTPLDGQQRLTTLFLLYWYLANKTELDVIRIYNGNNKYESRFSYENRDYSKSFFNNLVSYTYSEIKDQYKNKPKEKGKWILSECIRDQNWYGFSWDADPTVQAVLTMLDTIEEKIPVSDAGNFIKNFGNIRFFFLNLGDFGMTDKLYVKMNDRGKSLSDFDYTKSTFSGDVFSIFGDVNKANDLWDGKFDNQWMDCFWRFCFNTAVDEERASTVSRVEKVYASFINKVILLYLSEQNVKSLFQSKAENAIYGKYYSQGETPDIYDLTALINSDKCFLHQPIRNGKYKNFYDFFNKIMERLFYKNNDNIFPVSELLEDYVTFPKESDYINIFNKDSLSIDENLFFAAIIDFVLTDNYSAAEVCLEKDKVQKFKEWILFCRNMSWYSNTFIDSQDKFLKMYNCLNEWAEKLSNADWKLRSQIQSLSLGFSDAYLAAQFAEEQEKNFIAENDDALFDDIRVFENQSYYLGQIRFLMDMSKNNDKFDSALFYKKRDQINSIFVHISDIEFPDVNENLLRQVLLCFGDWSLKYDTDKDNPRKCFCIKNLDRDFSWKTFFRNSESYRILNSFLEDWAKNGNNLSFEDYAESKVNLERKNIPITDWRRYFIEDNKIFDFMDKKILVEKNKQNKEFILLRTSKNWQFNSNYGDLFTVSLYYKQYAELDDKNYTLSDKNLGSKNKVSLTGKNGEKIEVSSMDNNNVLEFSVIEDGKNIISNKTEADVRNYLSTKL